MLHFDKCIRTHIRTHCGRVVIVAVIVDDNHFFLVYIHGIDECGCEFKAEIFIVDIPILERVQPVDDPVSGQRRFWISWAAMEAFRASSWASSSRSLSLVDGVKIPASMAFMMFLFDACTSESCSIARSHSLGAVFFNFGPNRNHKNTY